MDRATFEERHRILLQRVFANRVVAAFIVNHADNAVLDSLSKVLAICLERNRVDLIAQDEQAAEPGEALRLECVDAFKLGLFAYRHQKDQSKRWLVQKLRLLHLESLAVKAPKKAQNVVQNYASKVLAQHFPVFAVFATSKKSVFLGLNLLD